jgi:hypothetical protein
MRKLTSFVLASALLVAGVYLLYQELFVASTITTHLVAFGGLLTAGGVAWFWTDLIAPASK